MLERIDRFKINQSIFNLILHLWAMFALNQQFWKTGKLFLVEKKLDFYFMWIYYITWICSSTFLSCLLNILKLRNNFLFLFLVILKWTTNSFVIIKWKSSKTYHFERFRQTFFHTWKIRIFTHVQITCTCTCIWGKRWRNFHTQLI